MIICNLTSFNKSIFISRTSSKLKIYFLGKKIAIKAGD